ncbi:MAG: SPOR domain-containing protein [Campylobacterota bacterium]|nr:SPOR domain-containing protein [Campylobacterota bacterium]
MMIMRKISLMVAVVGMSTFAQGDYVIQLGVYKNETLPHKVAKRLESRLKSDINVVKRGDVYWAYTKPFSSKASNKKRLKAYQKVFSDAYFREYTPLKSESKTVADTQEEGFDPMAFVKTIVPPKEEEKAKEEAKLEEEGFDPMAFVKTIVPPKEEEKPKEEAKPEEEIDPLEFVRSLNAN